MERDCQRKGVLSKSVIHTSSRHTLQTVVVRIVVREISVWVSNNLLAVFASVLFPLVIEVALSIRHGDQHKDPVVHEILDPLICLVISRLVKYSTRSLAVSMQTFYPTLSLPCTPPLIKTCGLV